MRDPQCPTASGRCSAAQDRSAPGWLTSAVPGFGELDKAFGAAYSMPHQAVIDFCLYTSLGGSRFKPNCSCCSLIFLIGIYLIFLIFYINSPWAGCPLCPCPFAEGLMELSAGWFALWAVAASPQSLQLPAPGLSNLFPFHLLLLLLAHVVKINRVFWCLLVRNTALRRAPKTAEGSACAAENCIGLFWASFAVQTSFQT